jgi:hypothetical protein
VTQRARASAAFALLLAALFRAPSALAEEALPEAEVPEAVKTKFDFRTDAGYTFDNNVSRALASPDILSDQSLDVGVSAGGVFPVSAHTRTVVTLAGGAEQFHSYPGLSRVFGSGLGEFQYRSSGEFGAPTFALFARATGEQYESHLRDGRRYSAGVSARKFVTDRISVFGAVAHSERYAASSVFTGRDNSARFNIDYAASASGTLYLTGEFRRGDTFSSGHQSLASIDVSKEFAPDDAFRNAGSIAYRFEAQTALTTLGYNLSLGNGAALDFSWQRVQSTSVDAPVYTGKLRYVTDQVSINYLLRF